MDSASNTIDSNRSIPEMTSFILLSVYNTRDLNKIVNIWIGILKELNTSKNKGIELLLKNIYYTVLSIK